MDYSFCETVTAGPLSKWHIRPLTKVGKKLGGGADTPALCGRTVSWDLNPPVAQFVDDVEHGAGFGICPTCLEIYRDRQ